MSVSVHISIDMEGIAGVVHSDQANQKGHDYEMMRKAMTLEANAAIEGSFDAGANIVVVNDSHGSMRNLLPYMLDQRAELISGSPKPLGMMQGVENSPDISMCIGYHSRPGEKGILSHTIRGSSVVQHFFINDKPSSEFEINAGIAGYYNVPIGMIAGDNDIVNDAKNLVPNIIGSSVKETINKFSAKNLSGNDAFNLIKKDSHEAVLKHKEFKPIKYSGTVKMGIEFSSDLMADVVSMMPGIKRISRQTISYESKDYIEAWKCMYSAILLAGIPY
jgi:D-amino peptidase